MLPGEERSRRDEVEHRLGICEWADKPVKLMRADWDVSVSKVIAAFALPLGHAPTIICPS